MQVGFLALIVIFLHNNNNQANLIQRRKDSGTPINLKCDGKYDSPGKNDFAPHPYILWNNKNKKKLIWCLCVHYHQIIDTVGFTARYCTYYMMDLADRSIVALWVAVKHQVIEFLILNIFAFCPFVTQVLSHGSQSKSFSSECILMWSSNQLLARNVSSQKVHLPSNVISVFKGLFIISHGAICLQNPTSVIDWELPSQHQQHHYRQVKHDQTDDAGWPQAERSLPLLWHMALD